MIDVSQWRASIGQWNYCQVASSRPANGLHSHSFKVAVDSKSGSTTSGEKTSKLPAAAMSLVAFLLLFISLCSLSVCIMTPPTGNCYQVQCTTGVTVTDTNYLLNQSVVLPGGSSSNLIYNDLYLIVCLRMLLLLSGDVERNPGPMIDDQPSCVLFANFLMLLVDWEPFALCLPGGITQLDVDIIKTKGSSYLRMKALHKRWLQVNPTASWRDVINALKQCKENELVDNIEHQMKWSTGGTDDNMETTISNNDTTCTSTEGNGVSSNDNMTSNANPNPIKGNPKDILRTHSVKLTDAITTNLYRVTDALYAEGLIPLDAKENVQTVTGISDYRKSSQLVSVIQRQLESSLNPEQYLIDICHVLINQQHHTLTDIATSILHQLGQSMPDNVSSQSQTGLPSPLCDISNTPVTNITAEAASINDVQGYADNMKRYYKCQPIVTTDWPPRIGKDFFGRLALVEKQDSSTQAESSWHLLRGQVDKTVKLTGNKKIISVEDLVRPTDSSQSLRVVIDGPPGIGKTTLCHKLLNMWSRRKLFHQQYDLVLYCPLRNSKIATATTLADLFVHQFNRYKNVPEWFEERDGEGLLIIFDGWDELSKLLRQSSLVASIICKDNLPQLKSLHLIMEYVQTSSCESYTEKLLTELEKCIEMNSILQEMKIEFGGWDERAMISVIKGVTKNKTITSLTLKVNAARSLSNGDLEQLLEDNNTLKALSLDIYEDFLPSSLNIVKVNAPLTALEIGPRLNNKLMKSLVPHVKELQCLILPQSYPPNIIFLSHPSLHALALPLYTAESAIELFTILQTNTTLEALKVSMYDIIYSNDEVCKSLQDMLKENKSLKCLEFGNGLIPSSFLPYLTTGLRHNTSLKQLYIFISVNEQVKAFIDVISQKKNLTELDLHFVLDRSPGIAYEQADLLPAIIKMLQSHQTIRLLRIYGDSSIRWISLQPNSTEIVQQFYETIFTHPTLEYIDIHSVHSLLRDTYREQKKTLIEKHRKEQPDKKLPIVIVK
uniref:NACHT domain-containing protein n=1 Tax=Amphimedon queenslandica TaxID=400682 RepID=A0A1X7T1Y6_AMPQE